MYWNHYKDKMTIRPSRPHLNIKTIFPGMVISIIKRRWVVRPSYLYNGNAYTGKTVSLYWNGPRSILEILMLVRWHFYTEMDPCLIGWSCLIVWNGPSVSLSEMDPCLIGWSCLTVWNGPLSHWLILSHCLKWTPVSLADPVSLSEMDPCLLVWNGPLSHWLILSPCLKWTTVSLAEMDPCLIGWSCFIGWNGPLSHWLILSPCLKWTPVSLADPVSLAEMDPLSHWLILFHWLKWTPCLTVWNGPLSHWLILSHCLKPVDPCLIGWSCLIVWNGPSVSLADPVSLSEMDLLSHCLKWNPFSLADPISLSEMDLLSHCLKWTPVS